MHAGAAYLERAPHTLSWRPGEALRLVGRAVQHYPRHLSEQVARPVLPPTARPSTARFSWPGGSGVGYDVVGASHSGRRAEVIPERAAYVGADIFDGTVLHAGHALVVSGEVIEAVLPLAQVPPSAAVTVLPGGILAPGCVDLQVNGGGGAMFNDDPSLDALEIMAEAHASLGSTSILPTLISDTPEIIQRAVEAVAQAAAHSVPGVAGLHLEGPHISFARKGAHDPALIRPMRDEDAAFLAEAAQQLPFLMVTLAPESVSVTQIRTLAGAGVLVSLGHSDAGLDACKSAVEHGARSVTHLFNAMSQLGSREPGLVGAALALGELSAGLIADMIHVDPETMAAALRAKCGPGRIYLVSDAMATAGSEIDQFLLNGRRIERRAGRLTLGDGTLAGADLDLTTAIRNMVEHVGLPLTEALAMATSVPAELIGQGERLGRLAPESAADFIRLDADLNLAGVWRKGRALAH